MNGSLQQGWRPHEVGTVGSPDAATVGGRRGGARGGASFLWAGLSEGGVTIEGRGKWEEPKVARGTMLVKKDYDVFFLKESFMCTFDDCLGILLWNCGAQFLDEGNSCRLLHFVNIC